MSRSEVKRTNDIVTYNLTSVADNLYKKARRKTPKALHHIDLHKLTLKFLDIFHCSKNECGEINPLNLVAFVHNCVNNEVVKLIRSIQNATVCLDTLR